jgi:hypothetical protein
MGPEVLAAAVADPEGPADAAANECAHLHRHHHACNACNICGASGACNVFEKALGQMTPRCPGVKMLM